MATETTSPNTDKTGFIGTVRVESSAPSNPVTGNIYYNSSNNMLSYYDGTDWLGAPFTRE